MTEDPQYIGSELDLFKMAFNWKAYIRNQIGHYIKGYVLEVGAGIGETTKALINGHEGQWTCLESDQKLAERISMVFDGKLAGHSKEPEIIVGDIDHPDCNREFDTILYIDVLEHIKNDKLEIEKAAQKLKRKGCLIVLAPAHPFLFSPFDSKIGHFRRYRLKHFITISPADTKIVKVRYLDCIGCLALLGNKIILKADTPSTILLIMWDRLMVPLSRVFDSLFLYKLGKSVLVVWQKN